MRVSRRRGGIRVRLDYAETDVLSGYLDDLDASLQEPADTPVMQRLFPAGSRDDDTVSAEYTQLTRESLTELRRGRIAQARAEIPEGGGDLELDPEAVQRWLAVLNDLRLKLGVLLDVGPDEPPPIDPDAPDAELRVVYAWLSELQSLLVSAVMG